MFEEGIKKMDKINIRRLEVFARHGVFEEETKLGQPFYISAELYLDTWEAAHGDRLEASVDYGAVCHEIKACMENRTFKLIEGAAAFLCEHLLETYPLVRGIRIKLEKPQAPIGLPFETVWVEMERHWEQVFLSVGSNMGDREGYIRQAVELLGKIPGIRIQASSQLVETEPYGYTQQPSFINGAIRLETFLPPHILLQKLHDIEKACCRERIIRWGPRTLDLDLIFYGSQVVDTEELTIPHIDMENRAFVLGPLDEIGGWFRHPVLGKTVHQLYMALKKGERTND